MQLIIWALMIYSNCTKAKKKQLNVFAWGFFTLLAIFFGLTIGIGFVAALFYEGKIVAEDAKQASVAGEALAAYVSQNPLHGIFVVFCGAGGFLFIRYLLDKKADVKPGA